MYPCEYASPDTARKLHASATPPPALCTVMWIWLGLLPPSVPRGCATSTGSRARRRFLPLIAAVRPCGTRCERGRSGRDYLRPARLGAPAAQPAALSAFARFYRIDSTETPELRATVASSTSAPSLAGRRRAAGRDARRSSSSRCSRAPCTPGRPRAGTRGPRGSRNCGAGRASGTAARSPGRG